jgi:hypothetical protein
VVEFADNQISPIATRPLWRWLLKRRPALPTPGTQKRSFFQDAKGYFEEINIKHVVVIHENQQVSLCLAYAAQASRGQTQSFLSNTTKVRMPREI